MMDDIKEAKRAIEYKRSGILGVGIFGIIALIFVFLDLGKEYTSGTYGVLLVSLMGLAMGMLIPTTREEEEQALKTYKDRIIKNIVTNLAIGGVICGGSIGVFVLF